MAVLKTIKKALLRAVAEAGNMRRLSERTGVNYATVHKFCSGEHEIKNIPLDTLERLLPDMRVYCFSDEYPALESKTQFVGQSGGIQIGHNEGALNAYYHDGKAPASSIDCIRDMVLDCDALSDEAIGQICKILKREAKKEQ